MPWHTRKPDPWYANRIRKGAWGIVYRVTFTRHGKSVAKLFRERDFGSVRAALKAARAWRDQMTQTLMPETKQEFSQRLLPTHTSECPGTVVKNPERRFINLVAHRLASVAPPFLI
jgi:hypothetical protein